jgi:hypothetical protein
MIRLFFSGLAFLLLSPAIFGQTVTDKDGLIFADLSQYAKGEALILFRFNGDGSVTMTRISIEATPFGPIVPEEPTTDRAKEIRDAAISVDDPETAQKLALLYREIKRLVDDGTLDTQEKISLMLSRGQEMLLGAKAAAWKPVADIVSQHWAKMVQEGAAMSAFSGYLDEAAGGLEAASPNQALNPAWIELIMMIIKMIMELLIK